MIKRDTRPLLDRAEEYVRCLDEGSEILDDTDGAFVAPFHHLLGAVLWKAKRLYLERRGDREVVTSTPPWLLRRLDVARDGHRPIDCMMCGRSWFDASCEHGTRLVIHLGSPVLPAIVMLPGARA